MGIYLDSDLSCCTQMMYSCKRLRGVSRCLYNVKMFFPFSARKMTTKSSAYSYERYRITISAHSLLKGILRIDVFGRPDVLLNTRIFHQLGLSSFDRLFLNKQSSSGTSGILRLKRHIYSSDQYEICFDVPRITTRDGDEHT